MFSTQGTTRGDRQTSVALHAMLIEPLVRLGAVVGDLHFKGVQRRERLFRPNLVAEGYGHVFSIGIARIVEHVHFQQWFLAADRRTHTDVGNANVVLTVQLNLHSNTPASAAR